MNSLFRRIIAVVSACMLILSCVEVGVGVTGVVLDSTSVATVKDGTVTPLL